MKHRTACNAFLWGGGEMFCHFAQERFIYLLLFDTVMVVIGGCMKDNLICFVTTFTLKE